MIRTYVFYWRTVRKVILGSANPGIQKLNDPMTREYVLFTFVERVLNFASRRQH